MVAFATVGSPGAGNWSLIIDGRASTCTRSRTCVLARPGMIQKTNLGYKPNFNEYYVSVLLCSYVTYVQI